MRFRCGVSRADYAEAQKWHDHFALIPHKVGDDEYAWLETIQRRNIDSTYALYLMRPRLWQYRVKPQTYHGLERYEPHQ